MSAACALVGALATAPGPSTRSLALHSWAGLVGSRSRVGLASAAGALASTLGVSDGALVSVVLGEVVAVVVDGSVVLAALA